MGQTVLVIGGGAPHSTLMSGALLALHRAGLKYDMVSMAGGGGVVGLIYLSPKSMTPEQALESTLNFGVSDLLYSMFPVNYKLFSKPGPSADAFRDYWYSLPIVQEALHQHGKTRAERLISDWILFIGAMLCPSDVNYFSAGLCAHVPFIEHVVDFENLKNIVPDCAISAYCIEDQRIASFRKNEITADHFRASMSFPFLYPPYRIGNRHYLEGAAYQCLPLARLVSEEEVDNIVLIDVMTLNLIWAPRNLLDAYAQSIIVPLVANARNELAMFEYWLNYGFPAHSAGQYAYANSRRPQLHRIEFSVPEQHRPNMLDWSSSNIERMFEIGVKAGRAFAENPSHRMLFR
jgi:NTE family protein